MMDTEFQGFCMKCQKNRLAKDAKLKKNNRAGGRTYLQGKCTVCGKTVNRIVPKASVKAIVDKPVSDKVAEKVDQKVAQVASSPIDAKWKSFCRGCSKGQDDLKPVTGQTERHVTQGTIMLNGRCMACGWTGTFLKCQEVRERDGLAKAHDEF